MESWILKVLRKIKNYAKIAFKRGWTKITPFGINSSRVGLGFWFKALNRLEIQWLNRVNDSRVESDYGSSDKTFSHAFEIMGCYYPLLLKLCIRECVFKGVMLA